MKWYIDELFNIAVVVFYIHPFYADHHKMKMSKWLTA